MANKKVLFSVASTAVVASAFVATEDVGAAAEHKVSSGESLWVIAQANNVKVSDLRKWNNLQSDLIFPNQVLQLKNSSSSSNSSSSNDSSSSSNSSSSTYTVKSGDSLSQIAYDKNVSVKDLMKWNDLDSTLIFPGNKLSLKNGSSSSSSSNNSSSSSSSNSSSNSSSSNSTYTVKSGDTLSHIAAKHSTSAKKIADLNNMSLSDIIHVGDKLKVSGTANNDSSSNSSSNDSNSNSSSNSSSSSSSETTTYVVKSGDTLSKIASAHGTTASKIASLSGISTSDILHIGDKLTVSGKASSNNSSSNSGSNDSSSNDSKPSTGNGFSASELMNSANSVMGTKYVWGGTTKSGFDCSGFIHWAYNDAGKEIPRTSTDGYYDRSYHINKSELQVGDLVFFSGTYRPGISHMGIYAGNNEFKHAGSSTGVTTTSLDNPYWSKHFDSFKRFY